MVELSKVAENTVAVGIGSTGVAPMLTFEPEVQFSTIFWKSQIKHNKDLKH